MLKKSCKPGGKRLKSDYAKDKLRENMGQCESKERGFKDFRTKVLKNCME
jgi:hypothetical protein